MVGTPFARLRTCFETAAEKMRPPQGERGIVTEH